MTRHPRPRNITKLVQEYHLEPSKNKLMRLRQYALSNFIDNQWYIPETVLHPTLTKKSIQRAEKTLKYTIRLMDVRDLPKLLGMSSQAIDKRITRILVRRSKEAANQGAYESLLDNARGNFLGYFKKSLYRLDELSAWEDELKAASRNNFHQPGYSMAANSAMAQTSTFLTHVGKIIDSTMPKVANPSNPINIHNHNQVAVVGQDGDNNILTTADAVMMLDEARVTHLPLNDRKEHFAHLYEANIANRPDIPSVTATKYDAQGVSKSKTLDILLTHTDRRIEEVGEIQDAVEE